MGAANSVVATPEQGHGPSFKKGSIEQLHTRPIKESRILNENIPSLPELHQIHQLDIGISLADRGRGHARSQSDSLHSKTKSQESSKERMTEEFPKSTNSGVVESIRLLRVPDGDARQRALSHDSSTKPLNAALAAMHKRKANPRGSNSSLGSRKGSAGLGGSNMSLHEFFGNEKKGSQPSSTHAKSSVSSSPRHCDTEKILRKEEVLKAEIQLPKKNPHVSIEQLDIEKTTVGEREKRKKTIAEYRMKKFNSTSTLFVDTSIVNSDIVEYLK
jgi:hypothetical protein